MTKFLKNFGLGLLLMLFSPLLVALVVLAMAAGLIYFLIASLRGVVRFFMGLKWFKPLEIDARVKSIKEQLDMASSYQPKEEPAPAAAPVASGPVYVQNNYYNTVPPTQPSPAFPQPPIPPSPSIPQVTPEALPLDNAPQNPFPNPPQISQTPVYPNEDPTLDNLNEDDDALKTVIITKEADE